jgi:hypothetical protein
MNGMEVRTEEKTTKKEAEGKRSIVLALCGVPR